MNENLDNEYHSPPPFFTMTTLTIGKVKIRTVIRSFSVDVSDGSKCWYRSWDAVATSKQTWQNLHPSLSISSHKLFAVFLH